MTASKSLPDRPSLESLRKQAKKLARDRSVSLRDAQLALARDYGFAGWQDLTAEVSKRLGEGLEWAVAQADRIIHDNDIERLKQLLAEYPALLSWQGGNGKGLLGMATGAFGDAGDAEREGWFTRGASAELLIDAGAFVAPAVCEGLLRSRARGLLELFQRRGLLPRTLKFFAALGDLDGVRTALDERGNDLDVVNEAFVCACRFSHEAVASLLLERSIALDPDLGTHVDGRTDRLSFIRCFTRPDRSDFAQVAALGLWKVFVMGQVQRALDERELTPFVGELQREPWLLDDADVAFQARLIETASFQTDRAEFIGALLDLDPAILRRQPPPPSRAVEWAFMYANTHLLPLLTRIWPVPDDLPYAAGIGNLTRVKQWFDSAGAIRNLDDHYPCNDPVARGHLSWNPPSEQQVLDVALAFAVINRQFDVADFLLEHGANINTNWNSHEPASILHHLVFLPNPNESMQFLIDRGIDLTMKDYRWESTAAGWARHALRNEKMAQWLEEAQRQRERPLGNGLERAAAQARRIIHDNDVERLKQLLAEYPALLSWQDNEWDSRGGLLGIATGAYADAGDPQREEWFTRGACAEVLLDAGAIVTPSVCDGLVDSRAKGLLQLFHRKGLLPRTLKFFVALGDLDAVRAALEEQPYDLATLNDAFVRACGFKHEGVASLLLERSLALDPELGRHIDGDVDRRVFVRHFIDRGRSNPKGVGLWLAFVMDQASQCAHDGDVNTFVSAFTREPRLLGDDWLEFQNGLIGAAILNDRGAIIAALFDLDPAILRRRPPPRSQAIEFAFTYDKTHLLPLLTRIWPIPDDLPHAAAMGNLLRVKQWFDESGAPALGDLEQHFPRTSSHVQTYDDLHWGAPIAQHVLDTALAWSVINRRFDVADFLLEHGANINTDWNSHEPASILHHLVFLPNPYESMQFLIDRGIDMTIKDYRWNGTAAGWARVGNHDEKMAQWLEDAERQREQKR